MKIIFRTDASLQIGTGHVMRCLTLADALRERGAKIIFICRPHTGHLLDLIRQRFHHVIELEPADAQFKVPADTAHAQLLSTNWARDAQQTSKALGEQIVDWLVVDHYALDYRWEQAMRMQVRRIMVIDDLADRPHDCDLLLDQNLGRTASDYSGLLNSGTPILIGPQYALLRPEFAQWRDYSLKRRADSQLKNLLITMGGVDQSNASGQVLAALKICELPTDLSITLVMGPHAPWLTQVQAQAATMSRSTKVLVGVKTMALLMAESDLCIGAAGSTSWERCCLGLPAVVMVLAPNQSNGAMALQTQGAALVAQNILDIGSLIADMLRVDGELPKLKKISQAASKLTDGDGAKHVVAKIINSNV